MKLLLIDYVSYSGHRNFNKIHIDVLHKLGHEVYLAGRKNQFDNIELCEKNVVMEIPEMLFKELPVSSITFRLQGIFALLWTKRHIKWSDYDAVIILTYDILSFFVFRIKQKTLLINHNNVPQLWSKIKLGLTRNLPHNYIHIALNTEIERRLKELLPGKIVYHVPHGICPPSGDIKRPSFVLKNEKFLLCPVNSNYDSLFVKDVFEDRQLYDYLLSVNLTLYVKASMKINCDGKVIKEVPPQMAASEYNFMLQNAHAVLLPYGEGFKYRCSGIFFECVARDTPIIATNLEAMAIYKDDVDLQLFTDVEGLIACIDTLKNKEEFVYNKESFNPYNYWINVLSAI